MLRNRRTYLPPLSALETSYIQAKPQRSHSHVHREWYPRAENHGVLGPTEMTFDKVLGSVAETRPVHSGNMISGPAIRWGSR